METKYESNKELLFQLLDEAQELASKYSGGYSNTFLSAEEFHIALTESIEKLKNGDKEQLKKLHIWFAPTCDWDDFIQIDGLEIGNKLYEIIYEIIKNENNIVPARPTSKEKPRKLLNWFLRTK